MNVTSKTWAIALLAMLALSNCTATVGYRNEDVKSYSPTNALKVKIYAERNLQQEYVEIGYVACHNTQQPKGDFMKEQIKKKAAAMGADAVVGFQFWGNTAEGIAVKFKASK